MRKNVKNAEVTEGIILPIICPECGEKIELSIAFKLLQPKSKKDDTIKEN